MKITVLAVGRLKEDYWRQAQAEYAKRLSAYAKVDIVEVEDERTPDNASSHQEELIKKKEGERLLAKMPKEARVIALAIDGKSYDSLGLSAHVEELMNHGNSHLCFVIGGSLGLSAEVLGRADEHLSFSRLTFPHQMMRVILLEQLYRCCRIRRGEPYHK